MDPHIVCVGGEDHPLRIPYLLALQSRGYRVTAMSTGDAAPFSRANIAHQTYQFNRFSSGHNDWRAIGAFRAVLTNLRPDIVHSFDTKPNLFVPLAVRNSTNVVRTINGLGWVFSSREPRALALRPIYCGLQKIVSRWTNATVFQNRDDLALFDRYRLLGRSQGKLIGSSGIDVAAFAAAQQRGPSRDQMRAELGLQGAEVVIYVGRLTRQKGIATLLKTVPLVLAKRPNARFVLVGPLESEGPFAIDREAIERLSPHVLSLGRRADVPALLGMADVFAFPTEYREGIPRVLLEAGLAGLPIVASRMPGCSDVVEDGRNGYLVAPGDVHGFATRMTDLLGDRQLAGVMGARSVSIVQQKFELSRIVGQYCDLYESLLNAPKGKKRPVDAALALADDFVTAEGSLP
jgi:glycosyltransferase involved in cell wall biosynthesis